MWKSRLQVLSDAVQLGLEEGLNAAARAFCRCGHLEDEHRSAPARPCGAVLPDPCSCQNFRQAGLLPAQEARA